MANVAWSPRFRNGKACRNRDDIHADVSLERHALPHKSGCSLFQAAVYHCSTWRRLVGISFISHSFQSWILLHSCYLQSKPVNLSQQYNYDIKINYRKFQEEKASFFSEEIARSNDLKPCLFTSYYKGGGSKLRWPSSRTDQRIYISLYAFLYRLHLQKGQLSVLNWYASDCIRCSEKPLQSQTRAKIICHQLAGKVGVSVAACIATAGGRPPGTHRLPPPRSQ